MPDIRNKETCEVLARGYIESGFNKTQGLLRAGYSEQYSNTKGHEVYKNVRVKAAILKEMAVIRAESKDKADYIRGLHEAGVQLSLEKGDLVNYTRNVEGLGRSYAIYTDKYQDSTTDTPKLTEAERDYYKKQAQGLLKLRKGTG